MSLLNQVLLDLDRRRASGEERRGVPDHVRALPHDRRDLRVVRLAALLAVLVLAAAVAAHQWRDRLAGVPAAPAPVPARPAPVAAPSAPLAAQPLPPAHRAFEAMQPRLADLPMADAARRPAGSPASGTRALPTPSAPRAAKRLAPQEAEAPATEPQLADIRKQARKPTAQQQAELDYQKAVAQLRQGSVSEARELLEAALAAYPAHAAARQTLTAVLLEARAYAEAERLLQEGLELLPSHSGYAIALARLQVYRSDIAAAIETLQTHADAGAQSADYQGFQAALLQREQRHEDAIERFRAALRLRPQSGVWLMGLGMSLQAVGRGAEAQDTYRRAKAAGLTPELRAFVDQRLRELQ